MAISVLAHAPVVLCDQSVGQVLLKISNNRLFVVFCTNLIFVYQIRGDWLREFTRKRSFARYNHASDAPLV